MQNKFVPAVLVFLTVAFLTGKDLLAASSCTVLPEDRPAIVKPDGKAPQSLSTKMELSDCSRLVLVSGTIHVLYEQDGELKRRSCKAPNEPCRIDTGTVWSLLSSVTYQKSVGGKQMDEEVSRLPGIPHGNIFSIQRAATFNMAKAGLSQWQLSLLDARSKKVIYRKGGNNRMIQVPANLLRQGGKYTVAIEGSNVRYKGGFDILGGSEAEEIAGEIKEAKNNISATARGKKLDELIILYDYNLDYEVELLREELQL